MPLQGPSAPHFCALARGKRSGTGPAAGTGRERGAAVLELALALPVFLLLIFGLVEFGMVLHVKGIITTASQEGARFGALYSLQPRTGGEIEAHVQHYLHGMGLDGAGVTATPPSPWVSESPVSVRVSYPHRFLVLSHLVPMMAPTLNLSAETVMLLE